MYNEELKTMFINEITQSDDVKQVYRYLFESFADFEAEIGKDICQMSATELQPMISKLMGVRGNSRSIKLSQLRAYAKWCIGVRVDGVKDGILKVKSMGYDKIKECMVSSPAHLERMLNVTFDSPEEETVDCLYRCFLWLAYMGVDEDDAVDIRCSDVNFTSMTIRYKDQVYPIYREALPVVKKCVELNHFNYKYSPFTPNRVIPRVGDALLRSQKEKTLVSTIRIVLSRRLKTVRDNNQSDADDLIKFSYFRVWFSGLFYRMLEAEHSGLEPDFRDAVEKHFRGRTYKLDSGRNTIDAKKAQRIREYEEDYRRWKLAFGF